MPIAFDRNLPRDIMEELGSSSDITNRNDSCRFPSEFMSSARSDDGFSTSDSLYTQAFSAGLAFGRSLQCAEHRRDQEAFRKLKKDREQEVVLRERYRLEAESLQRGVSALEDKFLEMKDAYDELVSASIARIIKLLEARAKRQPTDDEISFSSDDSTSFWGSDYEVEQPPHSMGESEDEQITDDDDSEQEVEEETQSSYNVGEGKACFARQGADEVTPTEIHSSSRSVSAELDASGISCLITSAHSGNAIAHQTILGLIHKAERTPKGQRSEAQVYLLKNWRRPPYIRSPAATQTESRVEVFVDASQYGIGFTLDDNWMAWRFRPDACPVGPDGKIDMSWAELIAVEVGIRTLLSANYRHTTIVVRSDNKGVVRAIKERKWTPNYNLEGILAGIFRLCETANMLLEAKWIGTKANPADKPSRGVYPSADLCLGCHPELPRRLAELLEQV